MIPASILYQSIADRYRPVSYPDGPITDRYRFIKNAYRDILWQLILPYVVFRQYCRHKGHKSEVSSKFTIIVRIPICTNWAPLVADPFFFVMKEILWCVFLMIHKLILLKFLNSTSRYLDDLLNIDNPTHSCVVAQINPTELQLNKAYSTDTKAAY